MLNVKIIVNNMLRKDIIMILGIGVPVAVFMILIGGGGHIPNDLDYDVIETPIDDSDVSEQSNQERMVQPTTIVPSTPDCDKSYPDFCIIPYPPDLDCGEIPASNFRVIGDDAHGFDDDYDGIGCEVGSPSAPVPSTLSDPVLAVQKNNCDPSYPDVCIAVYPPDLDCGDIGFSNFKVIGSDPHGFDRDNDGIGCES